MANFLEKSSVPVATNGLHKFPLYRGHVTTNNFFKFHIAFSRLISPCSIKQNHQTLVRTMPFKKPLYTSVMLHSAAFWVPFRVVWPAWTDFKTNTPHNTQDGTQLITNNPLISQQNLSKLFLTADYSTAVTPDPSDPSGDNCDFVSQAQGSVEFRNFTELGRFAYSLLTQLGIKFDPFATTETENALPLLCAAKVYLDYYFPNAYAHYGDYAFLDGLFQRNYTYTLTEVYMDKIFRAIHWVAYSSDYFVNAFDNPTGPNNNVGSIDFVIRDLSAATIDQNGNLSFPPQQSQVKQLSNGTPMVSGISNNNQAATVYNFSQYSDDSLKALTSYVRRHQLAGSRALERYLASYGYVLSAEKLQRCIKLDEKKFPLQVGEVLSTADTITQNGDGAQLGDYAGRAVAYNGDLNIELETEEFGMLIVVNTIIPEVGYVQGFEAWSQYKTPLDYLEGEFDGLGTQPIRQGELFVGLHRESPNRESIFGWTARYAPWKTVKDCLSGDFLFNSINKDLYGFESNRMFSDKLTDDKFNVVHSLDFMLGADNAQFNRLFIDDEEQTDKFIVVHRDNVLMNAPMKPLWDLYDFEGEDGKRVTFDVNGVKSN